jgi:hypothetical protein
LCVVDRRNFGLCSGADLRDGFILAGRIGGF